MEHKARPPARFSWLLTLPKSQEQKTKTKKKTIYTKVFTKPAMAPGGHDRVHLQHHATVPTKSWCIAIVTRPRAPYSCQFIFLPTPALLLPGLAFN